MQQLKGHGTHSNVKLYITALVLVMLFWMGYRKNGQGVTSSGSVIRLLPTAAGESQRCPASPTWPDRCFRIVALSDTHGFHHSVQVPEGDILVFAGDWTDGEYTTSAQVADFDEWMGSLPHPHKVMVSGNHDIMEGDGEMSEAGLQMKMAGLFQHVRLINDQSYSVPLGNGETVLLYGMPWQPQYGPGYQLPSGPEMQSKLDAIPVATQVLVTHGPPKGIGDAADPNGNVGDGDLKQMLEDGRITPRLHIFGHFHGGRGHYQVGTVLHANVGVCSLQKSLVSEVAHVFEWTN